MGRGSRRVVPNVPTMLHLWLHWSQGGTDHEKKHQPEVICCPEKQSWERQSHAYDRNYCQFTLSPKYNVPKTLPNALFIFSLIGQGRFPWLLTMLPRNEVGQTVGEDGEAQGSVACCSPWGPKELDVTEEINHSNQDKGSFFT